MTYQKELALAKELALKAGDIMLQYFEGDQHEITKGDGSPVTIADTTINSMVIESLQKEFPDDTIIGEEESTGDYGEGRRWICDPLDGTAAFVIGLPCSMFSLCLVVDSVPTVAVTYEPHRKQLFTAIRGEGSYCNDAKLQVSNSTIDKAVLAMPQDIVRTQYVNEPWMQRLLAYGKQLAIFPGAVFRAGIVAKGRIAGFVHPAIKPYDLAAGHLIVTEAGGKVTDVHCNQIKYDKEFQGAIVSNGVVHDDLVALFQ